MEEQGKREEPQREENPVTRLEAAKQRFANAGAQFDPLGLVRRRPVFSLAGAFLCGFSLTRIFRGTTSMTPLLAETALLMVRYASSKIPRRP